MHILESRIEPAGPDRIRIITLVDTSEEQPPESDEVDPNLDPEGPTRNTVPDLIVRALIDNLPAPSMSIAEIQDVVPRHPPTVYRQAWTLAANAPDVPRRLRGWVTSPERARYALTAAARRLIERRRL